MSKAEIIHNDAPNISKKFADTVVTFLLDCRLEDRDLTAGIWEMALEYAYEPRPRFWRDINLAEVVEAVSRQYPRWQSAVEAHGTTADEIFHQLDLIMVCNDFYEAMAEMMMTLPKSSRPRTGAAALEWICAELKKNGRAAEMRFAQAPEVQCGKYALLLMTYQERAEQGTEMVPLGTVIARTYRDIRMTEAA
jgi:hypothetical protein